MAIMYKKDSDKLLKFVWQDKLPGGKDYNMTPEEQKELALDFIEKAERVCASMEIEKRTDGCYNDEEGITTGWKIRTEFEIKGFFIE